MSTGNLDVFQQIYTQCFGADLAGSLIGTESHLQAALDAAIANLMTTLQPYGWQVTWGPRVWKKEPNNFVTGPDNVWFATFAPNVQYPDGSTYDTCVVAIAGTALYSTTGWLQEDFDVEKVVDFNSWVKTWQVVSIPEPTPEVDPPSGSSCIAYGTSMGVYTIMTNTSPTGNPGAGTNISQYLQTLPSNCRVIFTGHSLGGALSPTIPLGLQIAGLLGENTLVLPCAGASPGELNWSSEWNQAFPMNGSSGYQIWNADLYNTLDIVPQAWCTYPQDSPPRNLYNILTIYGQLSGLLDLEIKGLIDKEVNNANSSGVAYIPIQGNSFTGTPPSSIPTTLKEFVSIVAAQHGKAYFDFIGIGSVMADAYRVLVKADGVKKKNVADVARDYPVLRWATADQKGVLEGVEEIYPYDVILQE